MPLPARPGPQEWVGLPRDLKEIGEGAFDGCVAWQPGDLALPDGVTSVGRNAFRGVGVRRTLVPFGVQGIGDGAFSDGVPLTVFGWRGTEAEAYASANGHGFVPLD